ncbi:MAG TPA: EpsD family peptidyl-prolyl cis-trans isomerase [Thiobacillaceae bacterium]|nr:EpsD family peptidyl-prolyl cis-trans isomerase [Thiobacillaceae bacterium]HNU62898.1 EpsD family peptidyl-prolyl cis-trans isomerase [Thiobacillaceae bacterium]
MQVSGKLYLPLLIAAALAAGCGDKKEEAAGGEKTTQVAAKVNDTELTVHQVNYALQRIPNLEQDQAKAAALRVVKSLVDQTLLVQKAEADKLDRDPDVVQALDAARRQILADAWLSRKLGTPAEPTDEEINGYYNQHPELFSQRKLYRLQEINIRAPQAQRDSIRKQLTASKTLVDFGAWLKSQNIPFQAAQGVKPAEQLPMGILPRLAQMPEGQAMVLNTPAGLLVLVNAGSQTQPVTLEQARPVIARALQQQARQKAARAELEALRTAAKIEYLGEFADAGKQDAPTNGEATSPPVVQPDEDHDESMSKGISGLR